VRRARIPALLAGGALLFAFGVALGQSLEETPRGDETQTIVRTLEPLQLPPARITVTVTTTRS
jgi:hypothetical protein